MGKRPGSSEEICQIGTNVSCNTQFHGSSAKNHSVYLSLSLTSKTLCFFLQFSMFFSSTKSMKKRAEQVLSGSGGWGALSQAMSMYTHVSKCKNDKIK
jgi:hypothetical protein